MKKLFRNLEELWKFGHKVQIAYEEDEIDIKTYNYLIKLCREQTKLLNK